MLGERRRLYMRGGRHDVRERRSDDVIPAGAQRDPNPHDAPSGIWLCTASYSRAMSRDGAEGAWAGSMGRGGWQDRARMAVLVCTVTLYVKARESGSVAHRPWCCRDGRGRRRGAN
ncbi:hypothetical protein FA95DRAFT_783289 [Auriscalpium vulgare]|uniref:Uncharacterized protein n=1 Tax=Auriscalpium vulgare TaxID=40419 RepID=A0ACB8RBN5_9AGAM|nr:hypothetical protein FA95DRAFT_783289 [Auriscalpium vulgare]